MKELKVLFAGSTFPRWRGDQLPDFVWNQIVQIKKDYPHIRVYVLAPHHRGALTREEWDGVQIRRFRYFLPDSAQKLVYPAILPNIQRQPWLVIQVPLLLLLECIATLRWIREERFDFVYSHWFLPQGVACGLAALATGTPHVFTSHSSDVAIMKRLPVIGPWLVRFLTSRAHAVTVVSKRSRDFLASFFEPADWNSILRKTAILPMGVSTEEVRRGMEEAPGLLSGPGGATLLFIGRLVEKKGVATLLKALSLEPLRTRAIRLLVAGDGPLLPSLRRHASRLGISDRVDFTGFVSSKAKLSLFRDADIVVIPSIVARSGDVEGLPVVLLEALAAGKICVATDASGATDVITHGVDGFIVPEKDASALAITIDGALRLAAERRQAIEANAQQTASRFDWAVLARLHVDHLFHRVVVSDTNQ